MVDSETTERPDTLDGLGPRRCPATEGLLQHGVLFLGLAVVTAGRKLGATSAPVPGLRSRSGEESGAPVPGLQSRSGEESGAPSHPVCEAAAGRRAVRQGLRGGVTGGGGSAPHQGLGIRRP